MGIGAKLLTFLVTALLLLGAGTAHAGANPGPSGQTGGTTPTPENCPPVGIEAAGNPFAPDSGSIGGGTTSGATTGPTVGMKLPPQGGRTYYVAKNGNDGNAGTITAPFRTIARGSRALAAGDTLLIRAGTYNENMMHGFGGFVFRNGTASARTRYAAYEGEAVTVKPSGGQFVAFFPPSIGYVEISGMTLDANNVSASVVKFAANRDYTAHAHHNRLIGNDIRNHFGPATARQQTLIMNSGNNEIIGNKIHGSQAYGIYTGGDNGLIEGNVFYDIAGYAIHLYDQYHPVNGHIIRNNTIFRSGLGYRPSYEPGVRYHPAVIITRGRGHQFYNNIIYDNPNGGVRVGLGAVGALVANNTIYGNGSFGIDVSGSFAGSRTARVVNNIVWGNRGAQITNSGTGTVLQNNLTSNPNVVNAAGGDFHLRAGSPAIDKGQALANVTNDFDYGKRPFGTAYDIGAFEHGAPPGQSPSPAIPSGGGGGETGGGTVPPGCPPPFVPDAIIQCIPPDP